MSNELIDKKSIEELEGDYWVTPPSFPTELVKSVFFLRKKLLIDFDSNDLRILISQNVGLEYLIPKAIDRLKENILEEALYYPGDLLLTLLTLDNTYWLKKEFEKKQFVTLIKKSKYSIINSDVIDNDIKEDLRTSIDKFISHISPAI